MKISLQELTATSNCESVFCIIKLIGVQDSKITFVTDYWYIKCGKLFVPQVSEFDLFLAIFIEHLLA